MNTITRVTTSIKEHKKDSIFIFLIVFILSIFIFICYMFNASSDKYISLIEESSNYEIEVSSNLFASRYKNDFINELDLKNYDEDKINELYNRYQSAFLEIHNYLSKLKDNNQISQFRYVVSSNLNYYQVGYTDIYKTTIDNFDSDELSKEEYSLIEGRLLNDNDGNKIVVSDNTNYQVGDELVFINSDDEEFVYEVVGVVSKTKKDKAFKETSLYNNDLILMNIDDLFSVTSTNNQIHSSNIYIEVNGKHNEILDDLLTYLNGLDTSINSVYEYTINDEVASSLNEPILAIKRIYVFASIIMSFIMSILLCGILVYIVYKRRRDYGIMMTLGQSRIKTISSFLIESIIISSLAFLISLPISNFFSNKLINNMLSSSLASKEEIMDITSYTTDYDIFEIGKKVYDNFVYSFQIADFIKIYGLLLTIIFISSAVSLIYIYSIKTKNLLKS